MTMKAEVEDMLAEAAWRERNGLERSTALEPGAYLPPAALLAASEEKYRDCPPADAYDRLPLVPAGWWLLASIGFLAGAAATLWNALPHP